MRAVAKTASYGTMHFMVAGAVAYAITGDWRAALAISAIEPMVQTVSYVMHERAWERLWPATTQTLISTRSEPPSDWGGAPAMPDETSTIAARSVRSPNT